MPSEQEVYEEHALEYEALISHEDYQGNILKAIYEITPLENLDVLDSGAGTGRLACLLQPQVKQVVACDISRHMLEIARQKLNATGLRNWSLAAADHRSLPLSAHGVDLLVSGWSVSYVAVWHPERWREEANQWLAEARRVLRAGGRIIVFESLGTGNEMPLRLAHLENFYGWLDEQGFQSTWIRTDYRFHSSKEAAEMAGFFFGEDMKRKIQDRNMTVLPECTGVWWLSA